MTTSLWSLFQWMNTVSVKKLFLMSKPTALLYCTTFYLENSGLSMAWNLWIKTVYQFKRCTIGYTQVMFYTGYRHYTEILRSGSKACDIPSCGQLNWYYTMCNPKQHQQLLVDASIGRKLSRRRFTKEPHLGDHREDHHILRDLKVMILRALVYLWFAV